MEKVIEPDIFAELYFYSTEQGGRQSAVSSQRFGCLFVYEGENFDSFVLLTKGKQIFPGEKVVLPIKFLRSWLIKPNLKVGDSFKLRELDIIAEGKVTEVFQ